MPPSVDLQPLPKTIVDLIPELKDYEYAMVTNQVLLVDPKSKQVDRDHQLGYDMSRRKSSTEIPQQASVEGSR